MSVFWDRPMCSASAMVSAAQASIAPEHHVVEQFQLIAVPERPDVEQFFFRSAEHEEHILDLARASSEPPSKSPAPHPGRAAHDRGVHKINAFGGKRLAHTDVHARIDRAHVDDHGAPRAPRTRSRPSPSTTFSVSAGPGTNIRMTWALPASSAGEPHTATPASEARV